jgi:hypothetical protein
MAGRRIRGLAITTIISSAACGGHALTIGEGMTGGGDVAPADGRCEVAPRQLVAASTYPSPHISEPFMVGVGGFVPAGGDFYYVADAWTTGGVSQIETEGALLRIPISGGVPEVLDAGHTYSAPIVDGTTLIETRGNAWPHTDADDVVSIPRAGGTPRVLYTFDANEIPWAGPVKDGAVIYYSFSGGVRELSLQDGTITTTIEMTQEVPSELAVQGQRLIMLYPQGDAKTLPIPLSASAQPELIHAGLPTGPVNLVPCGESVCWFGEDGSALERMNPVSGTVTTVATLDGSGPTSFVFDGDNFFVMSYASNVSEVNTLSRMPASGGPATIVGTFHGGGAFALDDECLYWSSGDGIYSRAKTAGTPFAQ